MLVLECFLFRSILVAEAFLERRGVLCCDSAGAHSLGVVECSGRITTGAESSSGEDWRYARQQGMPKLWL